MRVEIKGKFIKGNSAESQAMKGTKGREKKVGGKWRIARNKRENEEKEERQY